MFVLFIFVLTFTTASAPCGSLAPVVMYAHFPGDTWIESGSTPAVIRPTTCKKQRFKIDFMIIYGVGVSSREGGEGGGGRE